MTEAPVRQLLWGIYERMAMVTGLGLLALLCLAWLPIAALLYPLLPRRLGRLIGRRVISLTFRLYLRLLGWFCACRFDLSELDGLARQGPLIVAANHPSLLDAVLIVSRLPDAVCVMKASLMDNPLFGSAARLARYVRNDGILQVVALSRSELADGAQLVLFPEGSRTTHFPLDPLQPTVGLIARRTRVPVQAVTLEFSTPYLGKRWPLWQPPNLPLTVRARLGQRFDPPEDHMALTASLDNHLRQQLCGPAARPGHD